MGVVHYEKELPSSVAPSRLFKAFLDSPNVLPSLAPQWFKSIDTLQGDGGAGTVRLWMFADGVGDYTQAKQKVDAVDKDNLTFSYTNYEGDGVLAMAEKSVYGVKFEAAADGGTIAKLAVDVHLKGDSEPSAELAKDAEEQTVGLFKLVESHLLASPHLYA